ncbi:MAG: cadherin-like beta sandwich domain-containing protein [Velocimicrobium sp.]
MKKNQVQKIIYICCFMVCLLEIVCVPPKEVLAASAAVNLSLSTENVVVDSTFSVVLSVEASEEIGNLDCYLSFDTKVLQFVSGGAYVTGGDGLIMISDDDATTTSTSKKYSMKLKAIKGGETTIRIDDDVNITCALDDAKMSLSCNQLLFDITDPERVSDDTTLTKLLISCGELSPKFSPMVKKYTIAVDQTVNQIAINAVPSDENATVSVSGNTSLEIGKNTIKITVTAPSGDKEVTKLIVTKQESTVIKDEEAAESKADTIQNTGVTAFEDESGSRFLFEELRVQVISLEDESLLPKNYEKTTIVMDGLPITVYTSKDNLSSDILLVYGMNQDGETGLYQYNRANNTLTKYQNEAKTESETERTIASNWKEQDKDLEKTSFVLIICILAILCIVLSVVLAFLIIKLNGQGKKKQKEDDFF